MGRAGARRGKSRRVGSIGQWFTVHQAVSPFATLGGGTNLIGSSAPERASSEIDIFGQPAALAPSWSQPLAWINVLGYV